MQQLQQAAAAPAAVLAAGAGGAVAVFPPRIGTPATSRRGLHATGRLEPVSGSRVDKLQDARGVVGKVEVFAGGLAQFLAIPTTVTAPFLRGADFFDRFFAVFSRAPL